MFEVLQFCAGGGRGANQTLIPGHGKLSPSNAKLSPSVPPAFSRKIFFKVPTTVACYQTDGRGALQFCLLLKSTRLPSFSAWYVHSGCPAASWPVPASAWPSRYKRHNREFTKYTTVPALLTEQRLQSLNELQLRGFVEHVMARNCRPAISGNQLCDTLPGNA